MRHKHADLIHAWAEGAEIEIYRSEDGAWRTQQHPLFSEHCEYRIKPTPKPDVVRYLSANKNTGYSSDLYQRYPEAANLKLTFDGETGALKYSEVIK